MLERAQLVQPLDPVGDRAPVREQAAEPAVVDVRHADALRLALRPASCACFFVPTKSTEPPRSAIARAKSCASSSSSLRLLEVDDVDAAALGEDEALHLRVPAARLVAEVDSGLQELLHGDDGHVMPFLGFGLQFRRRCSLGTELGAPATVHVDPSRRVEVLDAAIVAGAPVDGRRPR